MEKTETSQFSIKKRIESFKFALNGINNLIRFEHNARIHLIAMIIVITAGFICNLNLIEWCLVVIAVGIVFICEIFNTSIEYLADFVSGKHHDTIKKVKDLAAGGVLLAALTALIIGIIIFAPKVSSCF